jgi:hypothetical protein
VDWTKYKPVRKVWAAIYAAVVIGLLAAVDSLMGVDWGSELGLAGPIIGAALAAFAAYMRREHAPVPRKVLADSYPINPDPGEEGEH